MQRSLSRTAVAVFLLALIGATAPLAAEKPRHAEGKAPHATGEVVSVDAMTHMLTLKTHTKTGAAKEMSFSLPVDAKAMKGGQAVALTDLKPGEQVTVTYRTKDVRVAEQVVVGPPAAPASPAPVSSKPAATPK